MLTLYDIDNFFQQKIDIMISVKYDILLHTPTRIMSLNCKIKEMYKQ